MFVETARCSIGCLWTMTILTGPTCPFLGQHSWCPHGPTNLHHHPSSCSFSSSSSFSPSPSLFFFSLPPLSSPSSFLLRVLIFLCCYHRAVLCISLPLCFDDFTSGPESAEALEAHLGDNLSPSVLRASRWTPWRKSRW